ncbi:MAG TPA: response regulator transcription factor [Vicinamibacterales bacterium]|jgi:DNA-binding NarL/FixJ family response regulator|nr:response regulator transcription factor [Vicinamibacterales bacterium]
MIRVVLVDDQTLVRRGVRALLELAGDIAIVGEAEDGVAGAAMIRRERPDVVLLDVRMPKAGGLDLLRDLRASGELPPTILLTTFDDDDALLEGVKAGARGYLLKDVSLEQLTGAIRAVAAGETLIRPAVTERVLRGLEHVRRDFDALDPPDPLTKRETEILRLMAGGYSNREIADALGTAEGTIKNHASSILSKLGVRDRTRAVLKALERGYI